MIIGLVSTYMEGGLAKAAARSALAGCDLVGVFDGPIGGHAPGGERTNWVAFGRGWQGGKFIYKFGEWRTDADKRTDMLQWAKQIHERHRKRDETLWVIWIDGDEVLIWPEYLRDWCDRAARETAAGGFAMRIVEMEGSVSLAMGRVFIAHTVSRFEIGASTAVLTGGQIVQFPNVKVCRAGGVPEGAMPMKQLPDGTIVQHDVDSPEVEEFLARHRPPVHGEPHILHRAYLRDPERTAKRQHIAEGEEFDRMVEGDSGT